MTTDEWMERTDRVRSSSLRIRWSDRVPGDGVVTDALGFRGTVCSLCLSGGS